MAVLGVATRKVGGLWQSYYSLGYAMLYAPVAVGSSASTKSTLASSLSVLKQEKAILVDS
jgi:hypothetical protein